MVSIAAPKHLITGGGSISKLPGLLNSLSLINPLVVTDKFLASKESGVVDKVSAELIQSGINHEIFTDTIEDPTTDSVNECLSKLATKKYDCIVAVGGGSPMDTAKAAGVLHTHGGKMSDYKAPFQMDDQSLPIIAIPTTAGTGSEVTKFTIITDSMTEEKMLCIGLAYLPTAAIVDYMFTLKKPYRLTADTGIDALCHAMEAFVSVKHNPYSDDKALSSLSKITENLKLACDEPLNHHAREGMMLASTEAGLAFSNSSVTLIHGMSRPIGAFFHVPHGLSNAMLAPTITKFSLAGAVDRYAEIAKSTGVSKIGASVEDAAESFCASLFDLNKTLKVPSMKDWGIDEAEFKKRIPQMAAAALASGSPNNNPVVPTQQDIENLYLSVWNGDAF